MILFVQKKKMGAPAREGQNLKFNLDRPPNCQKSSELNLELGLSLRGPRLSLSVNKILFFKGFLFLNHCSEFNSEPGAASPTLSWKFQAKLKLSYFQPSSDQEGEEEAADTDGDTATPRIKALGRWVGGGRGSGHGRQHSDTTN